MSEHILHTPNVKRLERSRTDKVLAGVSSGLGRYFDLTPAVFRIGFVVLTILGGAGILVYVAAVLVMPKEGEDRSIAEDVLANRREHPGRLIALGLVAVAVLSLLARADTWPSAGVAWALVLLAGLALLWTGTRGRGRRILLVFTTLTALLLVAAITAVAVAFAWFDVSLTDGVGNRHAAPSGVVAKKYELGIGDMHLDLTNMTSGSVDAHVGLGALNVVIPRDVSVLLTTHVKAGAVDALGHHDDGTDVWFGTGGKDRPIVLYANVGAGHIEVTRAP